MATRTSAKSDQPRDEPRDEPAPEPGTVVPSAQYDDINYGTGAPEGTDPAGGVALDHNLANATVNTSSTTRPDYEE